jgi:hypothetical protein
VTRATAAAILVLLAPAAPARAQSGSPASAPVSAALAGYDLAAPPAWRADLPLSLAEISGLAPTGDGAVYAHGDEQAVVFRFDPATRRLTGRFGFGGKGGVLRGDFEDIQVVAERVFLVKSDGSIYDAPSAADGKVVDAVRRTAGFGGNCEVEGMAWDPDTRSFLLLCKQVKSKRWKKQIVVLAVSAATWRVEPEPRMVIPEDALEQVTGAKGFSGSAITRHPRTGTYLMVAGPERAYAEVDARGRVLGGGRLDKQRHPQPEGITVTPDLTLLISDESVSGPATITAYARRP